MSKQEVINRLYSHGWNPTYVMIEAVKGGIKVKGSLTPMNWGAIKFELYNLCYSYDKNKRIFVKTHQTSEPELVS